MAVRETRNRSEDSGDIRAPFHERLLGGAPQIREIRDLIDRLAKVDLTVMVTGETGTGKDIVARLLHRLSPRYGKPFIKVNCPSIPEGILESELFGYERGAFTGAHRGKPGRFELANEGTIFLDEICETPRHLQSKLLQVLDGEPFMRIGGSKLVSSSARVIAATNMSLEDAVDLGRLRPDICYRLSEVVVHLPPLRERSEDIPLLAEHFNYNMCKMLDVDYKPLEDAWLAELCEQRWLGNVRELSGRVKKFVATGSLEALLTPEPESAIGPVPPSRPAHAAPPPETLEESYERKFPPLREAARSAVEKAERKLIEETLHYTLWNRRKAAKLLDTSYSSLLRRIETYNIGKPESLR